MKKILSVFIALLLIFSFDSLLAFSHTFEDGGEIKVGFHNKMAIPNQIGVPDKKWRIYFTPQADTTYIRGILLKDYFNNTILAEINDTTLLKGYPFKIKSDIIADSAAFYNNVLYNYCGVLVRIDLDNGDDNGKATTLMYNTCDVAQNVNANPATDFMITVYLNRIKKLIKDGKKVNVNTLLRHEMLHGMGIGHTEEPNNLMYYQPKYENLPINQDIKNGIAAWYDKPKFVKPAGSDSLAVRKLIRGKSILKIKPLTGNCPPYKFQIGLDKEFGVPKLVNNTTSLYTNANAAWNMEEPWWFFWAQMPVCGEHTIKLYADGSENSRAKHFKYFYKENPADSIKTYLYDLNVKPQKDNTIEAAIGKDITIKLNKKDKNGVETDLNDLYNIDSMRVRINLIRNGWIGKPLIDSLFLDNFTNDIKWSFGNDLPTTIDLARIISNDEYFLQVFLYTILSTHIMQQLSRN